MEKKLRNLILNGDKESLREVLSEELRIDNQELKSLIHSLFI